jgi:hypothetical protein
MKRQKPDPNLRQGGLLTPGGNAVLPLCPMKPHDVLVATHGHCFDGMASAALFTFLTRSLEPSLPLTYRYKSCGYGPGMQQIPEAWLDATVNAILDFRYTPSRKLTWYFDHHVTAFASPAERDAALASDAHVHYSPTHGSCAKLIADVARDRFQVDMSALDGLIRWADIIDAARFASAEAATAHAEPVLQLAAVVEHHGDGSFLNSIVPKLLARDVTEIALDEATQRLWKPIGVARESFKQRVERAAAVRGQVVLVDLTDAPVDVAAKFVTYALYPSCVYSVMLSRTKQHYKLSIGYNPWCGTPRTHDIAAICRRYDGGGHPAVGACSFPLSARERAREAAEAVVNELLTSGNR